jgi:hypothetical protein
VLCGVRVTALLDGFYRTGAKGGAVERREDLVKHRVLP